MTFKFNPFTKKLDITGSGSSSSSFVLLSGPFDATSSSAQELFTPTGDFVLSSIVIVATTVEGFVSSFDSLFVGTNAPDYDNLDISISGFGFENQLTYVGALPSYSSSTPVVPSGTPIFGIISGSPASATLFETTVYATGFYI